MMAAWDAALPALNAARSEQGLEPLEHVLDQGRSVARVLVMTSRAFDFIGPLPPTVKHVGPRLDDPVWAGEWTPPAGTDPLVLVALSADFQDQEDVLLLSWPRSASCPIRAIVTTGQGIDPDSIPAPANTQVVRAAPTPRSSARQCWRSHIAATASQDQGPAAAGAFPLRAIACQWGATASTSPSARSPRRRRNAASTLASAAPATRSRTPPRPTSLQPTTPTAHAAQRIAAAIAEETATDLAVGRAGFGGSWPPPPLREAITVPPHENKGPGSPLPRLQGGR